MAELGVGRDEVATTYINATKVLKGLDSQGSTNGLISLTLEST